MTVGIAIVVIVTVVIVTVVIVNIFSKNNFNILTTEAPCILPENLCGTFWQQEFPAARSLGLLMSRPAKSSGRSCPTPSNRDEMN